MSILMPTMKRVAERLQSIDDTACQKRIGSNKYEKERDFEIDRENKSGITSDNDLFHSTEQ